MINLLGKKIGITQIFDDSGNLIPITVIQVKPSQILRLKSKKTDGYDSFVLGYEDKDVKYFNKPILDFFSKIKMQPKKYIYEHRLNNLDFDLLNKENCEIGSFIDLSLYKNINLVDVRCISKGKGFQGSIRRHGMHRGPMSHGSHYHRRSGSMGAIGPQRVLPGKKLPGKMGNHQVCMQNLSVIKIDFDNHLIYIKGSVPGHNKAIVKISKAIKSKTKIG